jgi:outer membrane protein
MKTKIFTIAVLLLFISSMVKAQLFVSGSLSLSTSNSKYTSGTTTEDGDKTFDFNFNPKVGFFLNDKFAVGLGFLFGTSKTTTPVYDEFGAKTDEIYKLNSWGIAPFARYYLAKTGNLSFFGEGTLGFGGGTTKTTTGSTTVEGPKVTMMGIYIAPALSYDLSDKFAIEASFGELSYSSTTSKQTIATVENKSTTSGINLSLDLTSLSFGAIFKF